MNDSIFGEEIRAATNEAWSRFLQTVDPLRPDLYRYCRHLADNVWEAEDLVQDTLEQAFARLGSVHHDIRDPRAYLLRVASNLWVDQLRRQASQTRALAALGDEATPPDPPADNLEVRAAAERLMSELAPQEQAAVLLKEVFEMTLAEIADVLETSVGAVKSALHRGRGRLAALPTAPPQGSVVSRQVLERFVDRFNARDREGMLALMLDSAAIRMGGVDYEIGRDGIDREPGWLYYNLLSPAARWEVADYDGEPLVLHLPTGDAGVGSIMRCRTVDDHVAAIRVYAFCPDAIREVAAALGRPAVPLGVYRFDPSIFEH